MDASIFSCVVRELAPQVRGMRVVKVFTPLPDVWTFAMGRPGYVVLCAARKTPFLMLVPHKPDNPANPSGRAMWFRKRIRDRYVVNVEADWPRRRVALELSPGEGRWLLLDLQSGPSLVDALPDGFGVEPVWPDLDRILAEPELWRTYPQLTPPLRRYLAQASRAEALAMLDGLRTGSFSTWYCATDHQGRAQASLWPMGESRVCASALEAAAEAGSQTLSGLIREHGGVESAEVRAVRRLERSLSRLEEDRDRLRRMVDAKGTALELQAALHGLDKDAKLGSVTLADGRDVPLDPTMTIRENMERMFSRADKGGRGLGITQARAEALRHELDGVQAGRIQPRGVRGPAAQAEAPSPLPARLRKLKVAAFRSSDGFLMVRGRNAQANHQLLTQGSSPFDYWLHAQNGPGAHVIIKRDFATQEVPEQTLLEGACLAALSSHLKLAGSGDVLLCLVRDIRTIKGAPLGMVEVDKVLRVLRPAIDPEVETALKIAT